MRIAYVRNMSALSSQARSLPHRAASTVPLLLTPSELVKLPKVSIFPYSRIVALINSSEHRQPPNSSTYHGTCPTPHASLPLNISVGQEFPARFDGIWTTLRIRKQMLVRVQQSLTSGSAVDWRGTILGWVICCRDQPSLRKHAVSAQRCPCAFRCAALILVGLSQVRYQTYGSCSRL